VRPRPESVRRAIQEFEQAVFDHVYVHQVGRDQELFSGSYAREILPVLAGVA
jgi:coenzyme F420-dependent glucose-6-phosphate dehydrogenase